VNSATQGLIFGLNISMICPRRHPVSTGPSSAAFFALQNPPATLDAFIVLRVKVTNLFSASKQQMRQSGRLIYENF
jgi:hypothetical protein